jgi:hypothetical protein
MQLQWHKTGDDWCVLDQIEASGIEGCGAQHGVYVIWRGGAMARTSVVLYVGRGVLRREIADCRRDPLFRCEPGLRVTWAGLDPTAVDSVAAYLYEQLRPLWGEVVPSVPPTSVNLPLTA